MAADAEAVRVDVRAWLADNWDPDLSRAEWMAIVADSGWAAPSWPSQWHGRGLDPALTSIVIEEFRRVGAAGNFQP